MSCLTIFQSRGISRWVAGRQLLIRVCSVLRGFRCT